MSELAFDLAPEVRTTDVDEAADALGRVYVAAELTPIDTKSVNMQMNALQLPLLTAGYLGFGVDIAIRTDDVTAYYIDAPLSGRAVSRWRDGGSLRRRSGQSRYSHRARRASLTGPATAARSVLRFLNRKCGGSWRPCSTALSANGLHLPGSSI